VLLSTQQSNGDLQVFQQEPVPNPFKLGDRYPDRDEVAEVRPIKLRLKRTSRRFSNTIIRNTNNDLSYVNSDAHLMTSRLKSRLDRLGELYKRRYGGRKLVVILTYAEEGNSAVTDPNSLHYEGITNYNCKPSTIYTYSSLTWPDRFLGTGRYCLQYKRLHLKGSGIVHIGNLFLTPSRNWWVLIAHVTQAIDF